MRWRLLLLLALGDSRGRELVKETWRFDPFLAAVTDEECGPPILELEDTDSDDESDDDDDEDEEEDPEEEIVLSLSGGPLILVFLSTKSATKSGSIYSLEHSERGKNLSRPRGLINLYFGMISLIFALLLGHTAWCATSDVFGLSLSHGFTLNGISIPQISMLDSFALSNDACLEYLDNTNQNAMIYHLYTGLTTPEEGIVCAWHSNRALIWLPSSGFAIDGHPIQQDQLHYGSMIVYSDIAYMLFGSSNIIAVPLSGVVYEVAVNTTDPLLGLFSDAISGLAYLALDLDREHFYFGFPLDSTRTRFYIAGSESIFIGGNLLNSRPQILKVSGRSVVPPNSGEIELESGLLFPLLTRESLHVSASQFLQQPIFTVPVFVDSFTQLDPYIQTHFQDLQIGPGAVLVLDLRGAAYESGDSLTVFSYATVVGQFSQIVLLNYASSSCLALSADGQFTGTSFYVTFSSDLSCTYSAAPQLLKEFYYY